MTIFYSYKYIHTYHEMVERKPDLLPIPGRVGGCVGHHVVGGGGNDGGEEGGGDEPPHDLPVQADLDTWAPG